MMILERNPPIFPDWYDDMYLSAWWTNDDGSVNSLYKDIVDIVYMQDRLISLNTRDTLNSVLAASDFKDAFLIIDSYDTLDRLQSWCRLPEDTRPTPYYMTLQDVTTVPHGELVKSVGIPYLCESSILQTLNGYYIMPGLDECIIGIGLGFLYVDPESVMEVVKKGEHRKEISIVLDLAIRTLYPTDNFAKHSGIKTVTNMFGALPYKEHILALQRIMHSYEYNENLPMYNDKDFIKTVCNIVSDRYDELWEHSDRHGLLYGELLSAASDTYAQYEGKTVSFMASDLRRLFRHIAIKMSFYGLFDIGNLTKYNKLMNLADDMQRKATFGQHQISTFASKSTLGFMPVSRKTIPGSLSDAINRATSSAEDFLRNL